MRKSYFLNVKTILLAGEKKKAPTLSKKKSCFKTNSEIKNPLNPMHLFNLLLFHQQVTGAPFLG